MSGTHADCGVICEETDVDGRTARLGHRGRERVGERRPGPDNAQASGKAERASAASARRARQPGDHVQPEAANKIAKANDGNRAAGTSGYDASTDFVVKHLKRYGWKVERQPFDFVNFSQDAPSVLARTSPDPQSFAEGADFATMEYSGSGDVTADWSPLT